MIKNEEAKERQNKLNKKRKVEEKGKEYLKKNSVHVP
jgi:hypothetical protein